MTVNKIKSDMEMKSLLIDLVKMKNLSTDIPGNLKALQFCQYYLKAKGIKSKIHWHTDHPSLEWGATSQSAKVLFNTHIDVVPAPDFCFVPKEIDGKLLGRGTADTKAMCAVFLSLSKTEVEQATKKGIRFVLVSDEEIGGDTTKVMVEKLPKIEFGLFGEPTNLELKHLAKGIMQIKITTNGSNAHGSRLWQGDNAIIKQTKQLNKFLSKHPDPVNETWSTTYNWSQIQGGNAINQVPDKCELWCDVRYEPSDEPAKIEQDLKSIFKNSLVEVVRKESPIFTMQDEQHLQILAQAVESRAIKPIFGREFGSSDARHFTNRKIPAVVFGPIGGQLHEDKEWVDLPSIIDVKEVIQEFILLI